MRRFGMNPMTAALFRRTANSRMGMFSNDAIDNKGCVGCGSGFGGLGATSCAPGFRAITTQGGQTVCITDPSTHYSNTLPNAQLSPAATANSAAASGSTTVKVTIREEDGSSRTIDARPFDSDGNSVTPDQFFKFPAPAPLFALPSVQGWSTAKIVMVGLGAAVGVAVLGVALSK